MATSMCCGPAATLAIPDAATVGADCRRRRGRRGRATVPPVAEARGRRGRQQARLRLVTPEQGSAAASTAAPSSSAAASGAGGGELQSRVEQLEAELAEARRLLEVRNAELATLQGQAVPPAPARGTAEPERRAAGEPAAKPSRRRPPRLAEAPVAEPEPAPVAEQPKPEPEARQRRAGARDAGAVAVRPIMQYWWALARARRWRCWRAASCAVAGRKGGGGVVRGGIRSARGRRPAGAAAHARAATARRTSWSKRGDRSSRCRRPRPAPRGGRCAPGGLPARRPVSLDETISSDSRRQHRGGRSAGRSRLPHGLWSLRPGGRSRAARDQARAAAARSAAQAARDLLRLGQPRPLPRGGSRDAPRAGQHVRQRVGQGPHHGQADCARGSDVRPDLECGGDQRRHGACGDAAADGPGFPGRSARIDGHGHRSHRLGRSRRRQHRHRLHPRRAAARGRPRPRLHPPSSRRCSIRRAAKRPKKWSSRISVWTSRSSAGWTRPRTSSRPGTPAQVEDTVERQVRPMVEDTVERPMRPVRVEDTVERPMRRPQQVEDTVEHPMRRPQQVEDTVERPAAVHRGEPVGRRRGG